MTTNFCLLWSFSGEAEDESDDFSFSGEEPTKPDKGDEEDGDVQKTCHTHGPMVCSINANCVDYATGMCCQCGAGYFGNGKHCITTGMKSLMNPMYS